MSKIYRIAIKNFRCIQNFQQTFNSDFICLIGRGDSGKTTILEAISLVLSPSWTHIFYDNDFYKSDTTNSIIIEVTIRHVPAFLLTEQKYFMYLRGLNKVTGEIFDDLKDDHEPVITIQLQVKNDLEPQWHVVVGRDLEPKPISGTDKARLNVFFVSDYLDRHFTWSKGGLLYSLLKMGQDDEVQDDAILIDALRGAKAKIDSAEFVQFKNVVEKIKVHAARFGADISKAVNSIDFRDIVIKESKISLHDETVPFRLKGKGTKRLISMAIQATVAENGGIVLIDEIEQGLEPDRVQHLVNMLKTNNKGQVFITTHSRDVLVELTTADLFKMSKNATQLVLFSKTLQRVLRANPEGFFAHKIVVAEGSTEIGICRALNEYRMTKGKKNVAYLGLRVINGGGNTMIDYAKGFKNSLFSVCVFCDSDKTSGEKKRTDDDKTTLRNLGIPIFDWDDGECSEVAILKVVSFDIVKAIFELAAEFNRQEKSIELAESKIQLWEAIKSNFGTDCPASMEVATDTILVRTSVGLTAHRKGWFKNQEKGLSLGRFVFSTYESIDSGNKLKQSIEGLSKWIDGDGS